MNIGYLHYNAVKTRSSMFGRPIRQEVEVSDWPLEELERFRKNRPEIFARMTTRLMVVTLGDTLDAERMRPAAHTPARGQSGKAAGCLRAAGCKNREAVTEV